MPLIYRFGPDGADGHAEMRDLLGGKGANLAEMSRIGLPVPPGFTLTTEACAKFLTEQGQGESTRLASGFDTQLVEAIECLQEQTGCGFGSCDRPLLVSVRSGARESMPGMMDTVLNLGLNTATVEALARQSEDPRFAWDCYRRFVQMFGNVVMGVDHGLFEAELMRCKDKAGVNEDAQLQADALRGLVESFQHILRSEAGEAFPEDPYQQLQAAISAVFRSWMSARAVKYRALYDIPAEWGTAVNVQAMVFGNMGDSSATGVAFTRNPSNGERLLYGEYLRNAQGEDVVAGLRTPLPITRREGGEDSMEHLLPDAHSELVRCAQILERHYRDMQDIEFTIQRGEFYLLQTRSGKRTAMAAVRIAVEMVEEKLLQRDDALLLVDPLALEQLLHPTLDANAPRKILARGLPASPGAASGIIVLDADEAERQVALGRSVILVRNETSPEDIHGMSVASGILTARGGMTSHAAVVARGMGRPCVTGASGLRVDGRGRKVHAPGGVELLPGMVITIDGSTGEIIEGDIPRLPPRMSPQFDVLMQWADKARRLGVRANAETERDAATARNFGAEGIGLARTEHMFFDAERIGVMRDMIMAETTSGRQEALQRLLPMQQADFVALFRIMGSLPVTVRLLDPPLHEFLPPHGEGPQDERLLKRRARLEEVNPMLGHRGCRLAVTYPEICTMQARAILQAIVEAEQETGISPTVEIMIPLAFSRREIDLLAAIIHDVADDMGSDTGKHPVFSIGTMIELPRSCLMAGEIAASAEFFSFGTNDLTQTVYGLSRDDASSFLESYREHGIIHHDPFVRLDQDAVGELMAIAIERGKKVRPDLKLGICGEHGGDPESVAFCHRLGLDYVSCSPYRVPVSRLAAAQEAIRDRRRNEAQ